MAAAAVVDLENVEPFGRIKKEVGAIVDRWLEETESHFQWLEEIVGEAKRVFQSAPDVELLPKTPSEKRKIGRRKRGSVQKRESSAKKPRSSGRGNARNNAIYLQAKAAVAELAAESGIDSDGNHSAVNGESEMTDEVVVTVPAIPPAIKEERDEEEPGEDPAADVVVPAIQELHLAPSTDAPMAEIPVERQPEDLKPAEVTPHQPQENRPAKLLDVPEERPENPRTPPPVTRKAASAMTTAQSKHLLPFPSSGSKEKVSTPSLLTPRVTPTHPINRYTPQKSAAKAAAIMAEELGQRIQKQLDEAAAKREEMLKQKIEEQKRKREERRVKVVKKRLEQQEKEQELKRRIEEKYTPSIMDTEEKRKLRPRYPESGTKRPENQIAQEHEKAKEKERMLREQEEMRRLEALERERQRQQQQQTAHQAPQVIPQAIRKIETTQPTPATKPKNPAVFEEPKNTSLASQIIPKTSASRGPSNIAKAASTSSANRSAISQESYAMTPLRQIKPPTATNYDISDLRSSDETDDEEHPRKKIPTWATGGQLRVALTQQYYNSPDLNELFGMVEMPDLATMFTFYRKRFHKRTSSAHWDSPIHPHAPIGK